MFAQIKTSLLILLILTIVTGVIYPLVVTAAAQVIFPAQANGSLISLNGTVVGSSLIGQANGDSRYFWSRPSTIGYNPLPSSGSNQGPTSAALQAEVKQRAADFRAANNLPTEVEIPTEMLFASGSGLDPHISPEAAKLQIDRVATARGLERDQVAALVEQYTEPPQLLPLGQPRVNVLLLNIALDALSSNS
ncbi:MAG TPA: potassium-transporting ATPase subunit KdpC [Phototrophicaceae bacterium]|jgi:K+-transporting ATPase ATPase C chain|nr:potassium-transporting ATPase subunit KdpC [Phototrophicaceae bacterium]